MSLRDHYKQRILAKNNILTEIAKKEAKAISEVRGMTCLCEWRGMEISRREKEIQEERAEGARLRSTAKQLERENESLRRRLETYEGRDREANANREKLRRSRHEISEELKRKQRTLQQVSAIIQGSPSVSDLRAKFDNVNTPKDDLILKKLQKTVTISPLITRIEHTDSADNESPLRPAHINMKYDNRRSRSASGRVKVLGHEPEHFVPMGSIFQAALPKSAKRTSRPDKNDLQKSTDYVLTHQETDEKGNLSTQIVKGSCVPTAGGGTAVVFGDVELLTHESPVDKNRRRR